MAHAALPIALCMTFASTPLHAANAIESAAFALVLREPLDLPSLSAIRDATQQFRTELPGSEQPGPVVVLPQSANVQVTFEGLPLQPHGVSLFSAMPNGVRSWEIHAAGQLIVVACRAWTTYTEAWKRVRRYLTAVVGAIPRDYEITEIGLQVVDKFLYPIGADLQSYSARELFQDDSELLTAKAFKSGPYWHVYQGWFDHYEALNGRILHQVNLSSVEVFEVGMRLATVIDHRASIQPLRAPIRVKALVEGAAGGVCELDNCFAQLHGANLAVLKQLLTDEKLASIGMDRE